MTEGHPDKVADQISDAVVDAVLAEDPQGRVACETLLAASACLVAGEVATSAELPEVRRLVEGVLGEVGYDPKLYAADGAGRVALASQSREIAAGVDGGGAGDQGMMFGYACDETPSLMPAPIAAAHALAHRLAEMRKTGAISWLRPDGKSQVTYEYDGRKPVRVATVVVSTQHATEHLGRPLSQEEIRDEIISKVVEPTLPSRHFDPESTVCHVNPSGSFVLGGPAADAGLTGRKIIVDTYGGMGRHGGGAFSGKDATKVDRSGAYAARWAAKNLVAAGVASRAEVRLAYAIGRPDPVQIWVDSFGTGVLPDDELSRGVGEVFDFTPQAIIRDLGLGSPLFRPTAAYGHFGRTPRAIRRDGRSVSLFAWECTDRADDLRTELDP